MAEVKLPHDEIIENHKINVSELPEEIKELIKKGSILEDEYEKTSGDGSKELEEINKNSEEVKNKILQWEKNKAEEEERQKIERQKEKEAKIKAEEEERQKIEKEKDEKIREQKEQLDKIEAEKNLNHQQKIDLLNSKRHLNYKEVRSLGLEPNKIELEFNGYILIKRHLILGYTVVKPSKKEE